MLKIETRHNLVYPGMLILFIGLRRIIEILIENLFESVGKYSLYTLIFISKFIAGLIAKNFSKFIIQPNSDSNGRNYSIMGIKLTKTNLEISSIDSIPKIIVLIFFASYFDIIGTIVRKNFNMNDKKNKSLDERLKGFQIISSALLCYYTIRTKIYRHNIFSLVIIFICLIIIIIIEILYSSEGILLNSINIILTLFSSFGRAFLDTIEKYLFEFNYMNPFKVMMFEGLINTIFIILIIILFDRRVLNEDFERFKNLNDKIYLIILLFLHFILSGLKNIYRVATIKLYSPMTRALAEIFLDPIIIMYTLYRDSEIYDFNYCVFYIINIFCLIIMTFCSCVYNDFIVLYCCGLEHDTYGEIIKRSLTIEIGNNLDESFDMISDNESICSISSKRDNYIIK